MAAYNGSLTYLGTAGVINNADGIQMKTNVHVGTTSVNVSQANATTVGNNIRSSSIMEKVNLSTGKTRSTPNIFNSINDRAFSAPSGYDPTGLATFGDGIQTPNTTWASDVNVTGKGDITYSQSGKGRSATYGSLAN
jgi:hypothetical protein